MSHHIPSWGKKLRDSLTALQMERFLEVVAKPDIVDELDAELRLADADLAYTVRRLLASESASENLLSDQKCLEKWGELWKRWNSHVPKAVGQEEDYMIRRKGKRYFDTPALVDALEKVAGEMLEYLDRVFPLVKDAKLFESAFLELHQAIFAWHYSKPPCVLGPNATRCALKWAWCVLEGEGAKGARFLDTALELSERFWCVTLCSEECLRFFDALPENFHGEISAGLAELGDAAETRSTLRDELRRLYRDA